MEYKGNCIFVYYPFRFVFEEMGSHQIIFFGVFLWQVILFQLIHTWTCRYCLKSLGVAVIFSNKKITGLRPFSNIWLVLNISPLCFRVPYKKSWPTPFAISVGQHWGVYWWRVYWEPWGDFDKVLLHPVFAKSNESLLSPVYYFFIWTRSLYGKKKK